MKNINITRKISQGMYVLTTNNGGCIVDSVSQISAGDNPLLAVSIMKKNNTNLLLKNNKKFAISILGKETDGRIIKTFGFNSMREINKFEKVDTKKIEGLEVISNSLGYMICEIVDYIDNDTHTLFIGKIIEADLEKDEEPMTYLYYQENKEKLLKVKTASNQTAWICTICGFIYYGEELPDDYKCPVCGVEKDMFKKVEE